MEQKLVEQEAKAAHAEPAFTSDELMGKLRPIYKYVSCVFFSHSLVVVRCRLVQSLAKRKKPVEVPKPTKKGDKKNATVDADGKPTEDAGVFLYLYVRVADCVCVAAEDGEKAEGDKDKAKDAAEESDKKKAGGGNEAPEQAGADDEAIPKDEL